MANKKWILGGLFLTGSIALSSLPAAAQDGILLRVRAGDSNYCHLKFPRLQEHTLNWKEPLLKSPSSGDIVDFYGPCTYDPNGKQAVAAQKRAMRRSFLNSLE